MLTNFNPEYLLLLETYALDEVVAGLFSQMQPDFQIYPAAFLSRSVIPTESSYSIYDKEISAIVQFNSPENKLLVQDTK